MVDFSMAPVICTPLCINGEMVEFVTEFKCLGITDNRFSFSQNANAVYKKINSRMYFMQKLSTLRADMKIMDLFTLQLYSLLCCSL